MTNRNFAISSDRSDTISRTSDGASVKSFGSQLSFGKLTNGKTLFQY